MIDFPVAQNLRPDPRNELLDEFAPPQMYYEESKKLQPQRPARNKANKTWVREKQFNEDSSGVEDIIGQNLKEIRSSLTQNTDDVSSIPLPLDAPGDTKHQQVIANQQSNYDSQLNTANLNVSAPGQFGNISCVTVPPIYNPDQPPPGFAYAVPPGFNPNLPPPAFVTPQPPASPGSNYSVPVYNQMAAPTEAVSSFSCVTGQMAPSVETLSSGYSVAEYNQMAPLSSVPETENMEIAKQPSINDRLLKVANSSKVKPSEDSNSENDEMSANVLKGAAHYSSKPVIYDAPQLPRTRVERVDLQTIPLNLPAPPMTGFTSVYPSQEDTMFATQKQQDIENNWNKQFNSTKSDSINADNIPFPSPYVQKEGKTEEESEKIKFDPSVPPPGVE